MSSSGEIPDALVAATGRAMARDPRQRFDSADEMASALRERCAPAATEPVSALHGDATVPIEVTLPDDAQTQYLPIDRPAVARRSVPGRRRVIAGLGVAAVIAAIVGVGAAESNRGTNHAPASPSSTATAPGSTAAPTNGQLPAPLDTALRKLEQALGQ